MKTYTLCKWAGLVSGETPEQVFAEQRSLPDGGIERALFILKADKGVIGALARALCPCLEIIEID